MLALAAPFSCIQKCPVDRLEMHTDVRSCHCEKEQRKAWGVTDRDSALGTIDQLVNGMHAPAYAVVDQIADLALRQPSGPMRADVIGQVITREFDAEAVSAVTGQVERWLGVLTGKLRELLPDPKPRSIMAWDISRMANLVRINHHLGRLNDQEAWSYLELGLLRARGAHLDWVDFSNGFLMGGAYWLSHNEEYNESVEIPSFFRTWAELVSSLQTDPTSPWLHCRL